MIGRIRETNDNPTSAISVPIKRGGPWTAFTAADIAFRARTAG